MEVTTSIIAAAKAVGLSPVVLLAICFQESSFRNVVSPEDGGSASFGVCQLKLNTAREFNSELLPTQLLDVAINSLLAAQYLKWQLERYDGHLWCAVEAYNKGHAKNCSKASYVRKVKAHMERKPWLKKLKLHKKSLMN